MGSEAFHPGWAGSASDFVIMGGVVIPVGGGSGTVGTGEEFANGPGSGEEFCSKIPPTASGSGAVIMGGVVIPIGATEADYSGEETAVASGGGAEEFKAALA